MRPAIAAPGEARHDWRITVDFAQRLETKLNRVRTLLNSSPEKINSVLTLFDYARPEDIWREHRESTRGYDLDITGLTYAKLDAKPEQWPFKEGDAQGKQRLYEDGIYPTADGKAKFVNTVYQPTAEQRESRYPFSLNTGRLRDQWHGMSRTGTLGHLFGHVAEPSIQMNVQDMTRRLLKEGDLVHVTSKRGSIVLPVQASPEIGMSQAFVAMHWGSEYLSGRSSTGERLGGVNAITTSAFCPSSKQPELKHAAVKILKAELPWTLLAVAWLPENDVYNARAALQKLMARFEFATCVPFGREVSMDEAANALSGEGQASANRTGILFRAAANYMPEDDSINVIEVHLGLDTPDTLRYEDKNRGQSRAARLVRMPNGGAQLQGFILAGDTSAEAWIKTLLQDQLDAQTYGRLLLSPGAKAPIAIQTQGAQVCSCFNVAEPAIRDTLKKCYGTDDERLLQLQGALQCGTSCGSCVPQLKRLVRSSLQSVSYSPTTQEKHVVHTQSPPSFANH